MSTTTPNSDVAKEPAAAELAKIRRRIPRFQGVISRPEGWMAQIRDNKGVWRVVGGPFNSSGEAWSCYKAHRKTRVEKAEPTAKVDAMLAISERLPVHFEVSQSLYGSSMNPHLGELDVYEIATRKR